MEAQILKKFSHIGFLDHKQVIKDLEKFDSISSKLDYLKELKEQYYDEYEKAGKTLTEEESIYRIGKSFIHESIFGDNSLYTSISIQKPVFEFYFEKETQNPELTYWFLKYNARQVFDYTLENFKTKIESNLKETYIKSELKEIKEFEKKAKKLLLNKELDPYKSHQNNYRYSREVVLLRILDGSYYKENSISSFNSWGTDEVQLFARYILWKAFLNQVLSSGINKKLLKTIRRNISFYNHGIGDNQNIISNKLEHQYLLSNFRINSIIKDFYFKPTLNILKSDDKKYFEEIKNKNLEYAHYPYSNIINGAYHKRTNLYFGLLSLVYSESYKINDKPICLLTDLKPYFKDYSKGFKKGYENFENDKVKIYLNSFSDKQDYIKKVFEFTTLHTKHNGWLSSHGFTSNLNNNIIGGFKNGLIEGYYYKAWEIVLSNSELFESLFRENLKNKTFNDIKLNNEKENITKEGIKVDLTNLSLDVQNTTYKNMPVVKQHYLPLINSLKKRIINNEIPANEIINYWENLKIEIKNDVYNINKLYNKETIEFCEKRIFPMIDVEIEKFKAKTNSNDSNQPSGFTENNYLKSTIDDYLEPIRTNFDEKNYNILTNELFNYFKNGEFTDSTTEIKLINKVNKKKIGWNLNLVYRNCIKNGAKLSVEFLRFGKQRISVFKDVPFDDTNIIKSRLYKYYTQKVTNN